jgi:hypothetical protein
VDEDSDPLAFYLHLDASNREGKTLLGLATARGWMDFADVLRGHGAGMPRDN